LVLLNVVQLFHTIGERKQVWQRRGQIITWDDLEKGKTYVFLCGDTNMAFVSTDEGCRVLGVSDWQGDLPGRREEFTPTETVVRGTKVTSRFIASPPPREQAA
jgi:hypothetical protein